MKLKDKATFHLRNWLTSSYLHFIQQLNFFHSFKMKMHGFSSSVVKFIQAYLQMCYWGIGWCWAIKKNDVRFSSNSRIMDDDDVCCLRNWRGFQFSSFYDRKVLSCCRADAFAKRKLLQKFDFFIIYVSHLLRFCVTPDLDQQILPNGLMIESWKTKV